MDTRFWGPSGWRLLHLIAAAPKATANRSFWEVLPFVLPCKFCRASLTEYYKDHPIPKDTSQMQKWLYTIHNCVNEKLRSQGQTLEPDPPFTAVKEQYDSMLAAGCTKTNFPGWDFLFSIADNHPSSSPSKPMPDTPSPPPKSLKERNRYNLLTPQERKAALRTFWHALPDVLPFEEWRSMWSKYAGSVRRATASRRSALSWLYAIRCKFDCELFHMEKQDYYGLCKQVATHRSGCATSRNAKTCRRIRPEALKGGKRKTRRNKQR